MVVPDPTIMPVSPKNGARYRDRNGVEKEFRYGSWCRVGREDDTKS